MTESQSQGRRVHLPSQPPPPGKPSVHLILLQFHLSPHETSHQQPLGSLKNAAFPPEVGNRRATPALPAFDLPPTQVAFQERARHAAVAGQAPGDFPRRRALKLGRNLCVE